MIKAIQTEYNDYRFRSRLEARWAVFFDAMGIKYEYEKEGFDFERFGKYLPDFWLPVQRCWVEIKPGYEGFNIKYKQLVVHTQAHLLLVIGNPWLGEYGIQFYEAMDGNCGIDFEPLVFAIGWEYGEDELWITNGNTKFHCLNRITDNDLYPQYDRAKLKTAYQAARSARFEFGETPVIK